MEGRSNYYKFPNDVKWEGVPTISLRIQIRYQKAFQAVFLVQKLNLKCSCLKKYSAHRPGVMLGDHFRSIPTIGINPTKLVIVAQPHPKSETVCGPSLTALGWFFPTGAIQHFWGKWRLLHCFLKHIVSKCVNLGWLLGLGPDGKKARKIRVLMGSYPCFSKQSCFSGGRDVWALHLGEASQRIQQGCDTSCRITTCQTMGSLQSPFKKEQCSPSEAMWVQMIWRGGGVH